MDITVVSQLFTGLFGDYWGVVIITLLCTLCAVVAAFLPAPSDKSGICYKVMYKIVNVLAANVGKAANADDEAKKNR